MEHGDIVIIKPNFHRPSRVGQRAQIMTSRQAGVNHPINQYFVMYEKDSQPDWINEYDLELVIDEFKTVQQVEDMTITTTVTMVKENPEPTIREADGKRYLDL